ncbi:hypothetical protein R1sor_010199 [Riccia sorocarpa]|uniref:Uncharacterized protein n=1 Tax=Riccia sorocarpa TaxID=122646 RepID=A0ABD3HXA8_9MARC
MGKAARLTEAEAESDSDGAPEEVNLSTGRDEAEKLRREEREAKKRVIAAAKEKRKKASEPKEGKSKKKLKLEAEPEVSGADELGGEEEEEEPQTQQRASRAVAHGLLDESIVKYLAEQEKKVVEIKESQPGRVESDKKEEKKRGRKTKVSVLRRTGKISLLKLANVVVLSKIQPNTAGFRSALEFRKNQLYGNDVPRSLVMIQQMNRRR